MHSFYFGHCLHLTDFEFDDVINKRQDDPTHKIMKKKKIGIKKNLTLLYYKNTQKKSSFFNFLKNKKKKNQPPHTFIFIQFLINQTSL